ncbi:major facilitator superfamily domain-containing protein [Trametes gibbosa]|nr:major facilitator superfamily domain-containing protein [Trametes gibbosa]
MDGGRAAWLSVLGGFIAAFCTFGAGNSFGVFQDYYTLQGTSTPSNISWIGSVQFFFTFAMGLPAGKLLDAGYFHHAQIVGAVLYVFSFFMLSLVDTTKYYQIFLSQGVGIGLGSGLIFVPALSVQAHHWKRRRALAMGIVLSGLCTSCGGVVYPIMLNKLFINGVGFAWGVRAAAFLTLGLLVIANFAMSTRTKSVAKPKGGSDEKPVFGAILHDYPYWIASAGATLTVLGLYIPYFYLQLFANEHGLSPSLAFYSLAALNGSSFFGRNILNFLADQYGQFNITCPVSIISAGLVFMMFGATTPAGVILFAILYGFFSGGFASLLPATLAVFSRDLSEVGIRIGIGFFLTGFGILFGSPIAGALINPGFQWSRMIIFSGVSPSPLPFSSPSRCPPSSSSSSPSPPPPLLSSSPLTLPPCSHHDPPPLCGEAGSPGGRGLLMLRPCDAGGHVGGLGPPSDRAPARCQGKGHAAHLTAAVCFASCRGTHPISSHPVPPPPFVHAPMRVCTD